MKPSQMTPYGQMVSFLQSKLSDNGFDLIFPQSKSLSGHYTIFYLKYPEVRKRIEVAFDIAVSKAKTESDETLKAWFFSSNALLDNHTPVAYIRDGKYYEVAQAVTKS